MRVEGGVHGVLGTTCLVGWSLYTFGAIDWGARGVAFFTLLGFVWMLVVLTGLAAEIRHRPRQQPRGDDPPSE